MRFCISSITPGSHETRNELAANKQKKKWSFYRSSTSAQVKATCGAVVRNSSYTVSSRSTPMVGLLVEEVGCVATSKRTRGPEESPGNVGTIEEGTACPTLGMGGVLIW
jgi:hypothetical protein